jgi:hypothetical protein
MESIITHLSDPGWWFSTVLVAIIVSIIAGFLKDRISQLIGHTSRRFSEWSKRRKEQQEKLIETLSENPDYLLMGFMKVILQAVMFTGTIVIYLVYPIHAEFNPPSTNPDLSNALKAILSVAIYPFFGGMSMAYGYKATSGLTVVAKAIKKYREKNGLPKLP